MELRELLTFKAIVEKKSFTRAAESLDYAQSTITGHVQALEAELGVPLFNRLGKRIQLTEVGQNLYSHTLQLFEVYERIQGLSAEHQGCRGSVRVGAAESIIVYRMKPVMTEFIRSYPDVHLSLINDNCSDLRQMVLQGELDMALTLEPPVEHPDLVTETLDDVEMVLLGGPDCRVKTLLGQSRDVLLRENIIMTEKGCALRIFFEDWLRRQELQYRERSEFTSISTIQQCVMSGLGISLLPAYSVEQFLKDGRMTRIAMEGEPIRFPLQFSRHKGKWLSPAQSCFMDRVRQHLGHPAVVNEQAL